MAATQLHKHDQAKRGMQTVCALALTAWLTTLGAVAAKADVLRQDVTYEQGVPLLISVGEIATIGLSPVDWDGIGRRRVAFQLLAANNSNRPFDANPAQIGARADGAPVPLVDASQLVREVRRRGGWNRLALAVAGGLNASAAGTQAGRYTEQGNFRANVVGPNVDARVRGDYSAQGYDGAAASAATQRQLDQTQALLQSSKQSDQSRIEEVQDQVLLRTTVQPNDHIVRTVVLDPPDLREGTELTLTVAFGGENHILRFSRRSGQWEPHAQHIAPQAALTSTNVQPTPVSAGPVASPVVASAPAAPSGALPAAKQVTPPTSNQVASQDPAAQRLPARVSASASATTRAPVSLARPPDQVLVQILIDEPAYLEHLSWAGEQIARHLAKNVKAGRRLSRAHQSDVMTQRFLHRSGR